jgi:hypothetical protein
MEENEIPVDAITDVCRAEAGNANTSAARLLELFPDTVLEILAGNPATPAEYTRVP